MNPLTIALTVKYFIFYIIKCKWNEKSLGNPDDFSKSGSLNQSGTFALATHYIMIFFLKVWLYKFIVLKEIKCCCFVIFTREGEIQPSKNRLLGRQSPNDDIKNLNKNIRSITVSLIENIEFIVRKITSLLLTCLMFVNKLRLKC